MRRNPFLIVSILLGAALVMSIALGAVTIPPGNAIRILLNKFPGVALDGVWPRYFETILWDGYISHDLALKIINGEVDLGKRGHPVNMNCIKSLSRDHIFNRQGESSVELLKIPKNEINPKKLKDLYIQKIGKQTYVTKNENHSTLKYMSSKDKSKQ